MDYVSQTLQSLKIATTFVNSGQYRKLKLFHDESIRKSPSNLDLEQWLWARYKAVYNATSMEIAVEEMQLVYSVITSRIHKER